jgi:hypothetical protein
MTSATIGGQATPARLRRSRHFHGQLIIGLIGLSALAGLCPGKPGSRPRTPGRLRRRRALRDIALDLADSDPPLDELFFSFTQLASGGKMPRVEQIRTRPLRLIARMGRRERPASADFQCPAAWWR